jgi:hypothetical protein
MRLPKVKHGHRFKERLVLRMIAFMTRSRAPDVVRTVLYRPAFFGHRMSALTQRVMRGPSAWPVGERELFAAFVSNLNQCVF